ncbi:primosomal protein N' [Butyricicoccus pullicaecorum]|uniref:Replication restart protein PriA n=1 Tax=Butyricicoccus pullicaecorum 1.2 TaxID=1203606 RepID=R8W4F6_9FIRM|nr:primosomal protein N' [Butyricicoccus pullicaecorum]EOQ39758.1 primosomal protein N' [Butyricicoccus pullicaecorum 1.2]SKA57200.1 replication restart DNA helicase PriA [Butyricicoccus pullicaecorum DSM 23266]
MPVCGVAVSAATYAIDKLYDYSIPEPLIPAVKVGCRVLVPFGRGNKKVEGMVLVLRPEAYSAQRLKPVTEVLDEEPVLDATQIKLGIWLREHLYCTFFDCLRLMLPSGLWFQRKETYTLVQQPILSLSQPLQEIMDLFSEDVPERTVEEIRRFTNGRCTGVMLSQLEAEGYLVYHSNIKQKTLDKTERILSLAIDPAEAMQKASRARTPAQMDVVSLLSDGCSMSQKEVLYMTGISESALRGMVRKGILEQSSIETLRVPDYSMIEQIPAPVLSNEQEQAYQGIRQLLDSGKPEAALLFGVTGSGKTQIYLKLIDNVLSQGRSAIMLVPEIGLTPQFIRLFVGRFGDTVSVLHSALSAGERYDSWKKIRSGRARVVIGTRSAVFAPVRDLGLIVLDEEQDSAYKSEQSPRYHARDVAKRRVQQENAVLVLGSATPSIESYYGAQQGRYPMFTLRERYQGAALPQVTIADIRGESRAGWTYTIGQTLYEALQENLERGEQSILFLNRRGNSRVIGCSMCGWVPECPSCSTTLTYHSVSGRAMCHFCGASIEISGLCPVCYSPHLFTECPGTQKVEEELHAILPKARVLRMDADTTSKKGSHHHLLEIFAKGRADILLGTQMVAKGLDFDHVTLVGVLDADQSLFAQDYRAKERTFSLITQVVGRAGRRGKQGRAIIQTYNPDHPVLLCAARQDYEQFYADEIESRQALLMPPVEQMLMLTGTGENESDVLAALLRLKQRILSLMEGQFSDFHYPVLGPSPASVVRVMGRYRYHLILRCPDNKRRRQLISGVLIEFSKDNKNRGVSLFADLNPDTL